MSLNTAGLDHGDLDAHLGSGDLLAMQWVNHEVGTTLDVHACIDKAKSTGAYVFIDATQALGKIPLNVDTLGADAVAFASQKIGGPPGAGALYIRRGVEIPSLHLGGLQERGRRAGTPDLVAWAGFGAACEGLNSRLSSKKRIAELRNRLEAGLIALGGQVNGGQLPRVHTVSNVGWRDHKAEQLVAALDLEGILVSAGAACSSGLQEPSPVLLAMYPNEQWRAQSSIRASLGLDTTIEEIDTAIQAFAAVLSRR